jgi:hypothetical protein
MASVQFCLGGTLYAADGSNSDGVDHMRPYKSFDSGITWKRMTNDATADNMYTIWADPANNQHVMMSDYNTLYWSTNGATSFTTVYHTNNSGAGLAVGGAFYTGNTIFIGTNEGVVTSTDNGTTFDTASITGIPKGEYIVSFAGAKNGTSTRLYCVTLSQVYAGITGADKDAYKAIYRCDWPTKTWTKITNGIDASALPYFISCAANDINNVYVAGGSQNASPTVYKSVNGGTTWTSVFQTSNNANILTGWSGQGGDRLWSYGEYALGFAVAPGDHNTAIITDLGFAHITTDGGASWRAAYVPLSDLNPAASATPTHKSYHSVGLENTTSWNLAWFDKNTMFGCYSDIDGTRSTDAGVTWGFNYTGHSDNTMYHVITVGARAYGATSSVHDMYQSTTLTDARINGGHGKVLFTTDNGATWSLEHDFGHPVIWLANAPNDPKTIYASVINSTSGGIYVTHNADAGSSSAWSQLTNPPRTEGHPLNIRVLKNGSLLASFSGHRTSNFTASSGVFLSTDGGTTWQDRSDNAMKYWTWDVDVDPYDSTENTWYAGVFSGWGGSANGLGGLYRTTNAGTSWQMMKSFQGVTSIAFSPSNRDEMYFTTEVDGLWYCGNRHDVSYNLQQVASYPFRQPMRVFYDPYDPTEVWVTSFGNGIWVGKTQTTSTVPDKVVLTSPANDATGVSTSAVLSWQAANNAQFYNVVIASDSLFATTVELTQTANLNYAPTKLTQSKKYFWRVSASNASGYGPWSDTWDFTTASPTLTAPHPIKPDDISHSLDTALWFNWTRSANATGYHFQIAYDNNFISGRRDTTVSDTTVYMTYLYHNSTYFWRVQALGDGGATSAYYETRSFTTNKQSDDVRFSDSHHSIVVAANPFGSQLSVSVSLDVASDVRFALYDLLGREVMNEDAGILSGERSFRFDVGSLPNGEYLLEVMTGNSIKRIPLVHIR